MPPEPRLITDRDVLGAEDTMGLIRAVMGIDILLRRAREKDDLDEIRSLRRSRRQIMDELERREKGTTLDRLPGAPQG